ncbi:hypothetical protein BS47DRAFT_1392719 [Hydnum rufescens UP504]|uniref:Uncharacterized protein n=1 Tax=Hydnum rufescens UP504 TaxID=1448309 RepID=A0A9P6AYN7_9AGAM|nr:hypothetical protein BS47DRAFT_1392719 [Hydnum rufescens UP504]
MLGHALPLIPVLALTIFSFFASSYVIISTILPILPPHPLSRRLPRQAFGLAKRSLTPAQRATLYIAVCDIVALAAFMWEAIVETTAHSPIAGPEVSPGAAARLWVALTARQSCLLVVAVLTLVYLRLGKTLTFGKKDFFLWAPSTALIILSTACASGFSAVGIDSFFVGAMAYTAVVAISATTAFACLLLSLFNIQKHLAATSLARDVWPPMVEKTRARGSFTTEDIDALRDGSSWLTSERSMRTQSTSQFSFSTHSSAAAPSSVNPYSNSIPAKSGFWFGAASTQNLVEGVADEAVPPVPELPDAYRRTSSPVPVEADPFRREAPPHLRPGSFASSWLTEPSGSVSTPTQFSFPTTRPSSPAQSSHDLHATNPSRSAGRMETPATATAFSPSPRVSHEQYHNRPSNDRLIKPRPVVLGGYGPSSSGIDPERGLTAAKAGGEMLTPWRMLGWFLSIWVPLGLALPYLTMNFISGPSNTIIPLVLLTLSVTLSSPILAIHVLCSSSPVPFTPAELFAPSHVRRESLNGSFSTTTVSSGPALPYDMVAHAQSQLTVTAGRRSGDIWIEKGYASDASDSKVSRILGMASPKPKLFSLDGSIPNSRESRTLTNPTPEPKAFAFPTVVAAKYDPDPIIEAASKILAEQAAQKAERARLESKASSYYSQPEESFHANIMVAQRHFSTMAFASTIHLPPSKPTTPSLQTEFDALVPDVEPSQDRPLGSSTAISKRSASSSSHLRTRSSSSVITARTQSMKDVNARSSPLTPPPAFPLPPTPQSVRSIAQHARSYSDSTSFVTPQSKKASIDTFEIDALSAQMLSSFPPDIHVGSDIIVRDEWRESFSTREYKTAFSGSSGMFRAIDEEEVEGLIIGGSAPSSTPKSKRSKMMSIPENASFSSPEVHSTPKRRQHSKKHFSLPSLNLRKGQMWKDEITLALEELGILTTEGDDGRPKTVYGGETPPRPTANSSARDSSAPGALSSGRRVPPSLDLPPVVTHFEASGSIQKLIAENTDSQAITPLTSDFIVPHPDGTPLAMAVPQPTTYSAPNVFHRPSYVQNQQQQQQHQQHQPGRSSIVYITSRTSNPISVYRDPPVPSTNDADTQDSGPAVASALPLHVRPSPRAWPPNAAALARAAEQAISSFTTFGRGASASPPKSNPDSELAEPDAPVVQHSTPLRPLSLLQGRNSNTPKDSATTQPLATPKQPSTTPKRSNAPSSTGTTAEKKRRSKAGGFQDENQMVPSTPGSGLKPLKLARSATSKARGVLRKEEVLPSVVVRPPSTSSHNGFAYSFLRGMS